MLWLFLLLGCNKISPKNAMSSKAKFGFTYQSIEEGLLVVKVPEHMNAYQAGLRLGDIIVQIEEQPAQEGLTLIQDVSIQNLSITVQPALQTSYVEMDLIRGPVPIIPSKLSSEILQFQEAIVQKKFAKAVVFLQSIPQEDQRSEVILPFLEMTQRNAPQYLQQYFEVLLAFEDGDAPLWMALIEMASEMEYWDLVIASYKKLQPFLGQDLLWNEQFIDSGGFGNSHLLASQAYLKLNQTEESITLLKQFSQHHLLGKYQEQNPKQWEYFTLEAKGLLRRPSTEVPLTNGTIWNLAEESKPWVLLTFWASWCGPCSRELPELDEWSKEYPDVQVLAINVEDVPLEFVQKSLQEWDVSLMGGQYHSSLNNYPFSGIPTVYLLDQNGDIVFQREGYSSKTIHDISEVIANHQIDAAAKKLAKGVQNPDLHLQITDIISLPQLSSLENIDNHIIAYADGQIPTVLAEMEQLRDWTPSNKSHLLSSEHLLAQPMFQEDKGTAMIMANQGGLVMRKFNATSELEWVQHFPSYIQDFVVLHDRIWVALENALVIFNAEGEVIYQGNEHFIDLKKIDDQVLGLGNGQVSLTLDGEHLLQKTILSLQHSQGFEHQVSEGLLYGPEMRAAIQTSWGLVVQQRDGNVVGLSQDKTLFILETEEKMQVVAMNVDEDPQTELLLLLPHQGLVQLEVYPPDQTDQIDVHKDVQ